MTRETTPRDRAIETLLKAKQMEALNEELVKQGKMEKIVKRDEDGTLRYRFVPKSTCKRNNKH